MGNLEGTEVLGLLIGDDDGWSVGKEMGRFEGVQQVCKQKRERG